MQKKICNIFLKICSGLEIAMSCMLITVIIALICRVIYDSPALFTGAPSEVLDSFFSIIMILAVGVEFIKMLVLHSTSAVIDVLVFAIARQLIIGHGDYKETILGILSLALLFAIKHFFIDKNNPLQNQKKDN